MKTLPLLLLILPACYAGCETDKATTDISDLKGVELPDISGYPIAGTRQTSFFDNNTETRTQYPGDDFYGQNANYPGNTPSYVDNGDGTVSDWVTGLMWQASFDHNGDGSIDYSDKVVYSEIQNTVDTASTAGYNDWRLPSIKEMYSLILFSGRDIAAESTTAEGNTPFIDTEYFEFAYGDLSAGERLIDMQCATTSLYVSSEIPETVFGVNFADGRIKGYQTSSPKGEKAFNYLLVRGNPEYGFNNFRDNRDGTITDEATGLMWTQDDNGEGINWQTALQYAESSEFAGYSDWRLPDAKELQSIVDYSRSPASDRTAAINPLFNCTKIENEAGQSDFPWYWSNTTHANERSGQEGSAGVYLCFGRALGNMVQMNSSADNWIDIHGAGAQRSDPKTGDPSFYEGGRGPQGDAVRINNFVRLVRYAD